MTNTVKKSIFVLIGLICVLFINKRLQSQYNSQSTQLFIIDKQKINKFFIQTNSDAIELYRIDSLWTISGNDSFLVKQASIDNFFNKVLSVNKETLVSKKTNKWATYSVDDSTGTHLALLDENDNTISYAVFGRSKSDYARNYVRTQQDPQVYLTDESILYYLSTNESYWGEIPKSEEIISPPTDSTIITN